MCMYTYTKEIPFTMPNYNICRSDRATWNNLAGFRSGAFVPGIFFTAKARALRVQYLVP